MIEHHYHICHHCGQLIAPSLGQGLGEACPACGSADIGVCERSILPLHLVESQQPSLEVRFRQWLQDCLSTITQKVLPLQWLNS